MKKLLFLFLIVSPSLFAQISITPIGPFCASDPSIVLSGSPGGGVWSGAGITNSSTGVFNPVIAGVGMHKIKYTIGMNMDSIFITVNALPVPVFALADDQMCKDDIAQSIIGAMPMGGIFSGAGVVGNFYDPSLTTVGAHTITYHITDANGCIGIASDVMKVNALPNVNLGSDTTICAGDKVTLDAGTFVAYLWNDTSSFWKMTTSSPGTFLVKYGMSMGVVLLTLLMYLLLYVAMFSKSEEKCLKIKIKMELKMEVN